jgi:hypothetical protein
MSVGKARSLPTSGAPESIIVYALRCDVIKLFMAVIWNVLIKLKRLPLASFSSLV